MGGACSTHEINEYFFFWLVNLKGGDHLKDLGIDLRVILE